MPVAFGNVMCVIPAKAGIHELAYWIPAFAGMTISDAVFHSQYERVTSISNILKGKEIGPS